MRQYYWLMETVENIILGVLSFYIYAAQYIPPHRKFLKVWGGLISSKVTIKK